MMCNKYLSTKLKIEDVIKRYIVINKKMMDKREFPQKAKSDIIEKSNILKDLTILDCGYVAETKKFSYSLLDIYSKTDDNSLSFDIDTRRRIKFSLMDFV